MVIFCMAPNDPPCSCSLEQAVSSTFCGDCGHAAGVHRSHGAVPPRTSVSDTSAGAFGNAAAHLIARSAEQAGQGANASSGPSSSLLIRAFANNEKSTHKKARRGRASYTSSSLASLPKGPAPLPVSFTVVLCPTVCLVAFYQSLAYTSTGFPRQPGNSQEE